MARHCCAMAALQLLSACIAGPAAAATPLSLDGEWQLANVGPPARPASGPSPPAPPRCWLTPGANLALMVRLVPHNATSLEALAWVAFTDNHFYLRPSESRAVSVRKLGQGEQVTSVTAEGWNLE